MNNDKAKHLRDKFVAIRVMKGETLLDMSKKMGVPPATLSAVENGKYIITENLYSAIRESILKNYEIDIDKFDEKVSESDSLADLIRNNNKITNTETSKGGDDGSKTKKIYDRIMKENEGRKISNKPRGYIVRYNSRGGFDIGDLFYLLEDLL